MKEMIKIFNNKMKGFIDKDITEYFLRNNPQGVSYSEIGCCYYKLREIQGKKILGAFGYSRFTNERYYEIDELGNLIYSWSCIECYIVGDSESKLYMIENNREGFKRAREFGIPLDF